MGIAVVPCKSGFNLAERAFLHLSYDDNISPENKCFIVPKKTIFMNNEMLIKFPESIRGKDLYIIQTFNFHENPADDLLELLLAADTAFTSSARRITAVVPILYGSRQDRKTGARTTVTISTIAKLLKSVHIDRVVTVSLHSPQSAAAFYGAGMRFDNLSTAELFLPTIINLNKEHNFVIVSPDVGGLPKARYYAKQINAELAFGDKRRITENQAEILNVIGDVKGRNCFIIDDMIDTGGSAIEIGNRLKNMGAEKIYYLATHLILSGNAAQKLNKSPFEKIFGTDSVPIKVNPEGFDKFKIFSIEKLLAKTISNIHRDSPVSDLYEHKL